MVMLYGGREKNYTVQSGEHNFNLCDHVHRKRVYLFYLSDRAHSQEKGVLYLSDYIQRKRVY